MKNIGVIYLEEFRKVVQQSVEEINKAYPDTFVDHAGIKPNFDENFRYDCTPTNAVVFAWTGGDGVHFSILEISSLIQPIIMTVPMSFGKSMNAYNWILGENLNEFLSLGFHNGWFPLEQLCYDKDSIIKFYKKENIKEGDMLQGDFHFIKKLRLKIGYNHIPLNIDRLKELEKLYFSKLQFNAKFVEMINQRK